MFIKQIYPILEFDANRTAVIEPSNIIKKIEILEHCVISFFREVIENREGIREKLVDLTMEICLKL